MIFGYVLLNDWSARDIQAWEYQPLGHSKEKLSGPPLALGSSPKQPLSPFEPRRLIGKRRCSAAEQSQPSGYDIELEHIFDLLVPHRAHGSTKPTLCTSTILLRSNWHIMRLAAAPEHWRSIGLWNYLWTDVGRIRFAPRNVLGWQNPIALNTGEIRTFIEDGDELTLRGRAIGDYTIGFGECSGIILPAPAFP